VFVCAFICKDPLPTVILYIIVKILDWGEDGIATAAETAALRASFQQEVAVWHKLDNPNVTKVKLTFAGVHNVMFSSVLDAICLIL
jgi:hypothetical protein